MSTKRRTILRGAVGAFTACALAPLGRAFAQAPLTVVPVTGALRLVTGAGANVLVRATERGQTLVDAGSAELTDALQATLAELPGAGRVGTLFNTHWHRDQVGGNAAFGAAGAAIVAHEKTRVRCATEYYLGPHEDRYEPALPAAAEPTEAFFAEGATTIDGERVEYGHLLQAHTDGDIYVFFRDANVLAVGDAIAPDRDPVLDWFGGGWLGGRLDVQKRLLEMIDADSRLVPSYGPVVGRAELQAELEFTQAAFDVFFEYVRKGYAAEDIVAEGLLEGLGRTLDDPLAFAYAAHKGFWAHHNTLSPDIV